MSGHLSYGSTKKLITAVETLFDATGWKESTNSKTKSKWQWKLNLITLTLPAKQDISDTDLRRNYLNHFLIVLMTKFKCNGYVWRMEPQANGNAHFHIVTDVYFPHDALRYTWNKILSKGSFIEKFREKHGHENPNSTDIHSLQHVNNVSAYLAKYMSKNHDGDTVRKIDGKLWGCSSNLQGKGTVTVKGQEAQDIHDALDSALRSGELRYYRADYCELYFSFGNKPIFEYTSYEACIAYARQLSDIMADKPPS